MKAQIITQDECPGRPGVTSIGIMLGDSNGQHVRYAVCIDKEETDRSLLKKLSTLIKCVKRNTHGVEGEGVLTGNEINASDYPTPTGGTPLIEPKKDVTQKRIPEWAAEWAEILEHYQAGEEIVYLGIRMTVIARSQAMATWLETLNEDLYIPESIYCQYADSTGKIRHHQFHPPEAIALLKTKPVSEPKPEAATLGAECPEIILYNKPEDTTRFHNRSLMVVKAPESWSNDDVIQFADRNYPAGTAVGWTTVNHEGVERFRASDSLGEHQHFVILIG